MSDIPEEQQHVHDPSAVGTEDQDKDPSASFMLNESAIEAAAAAAVAAVGDMHEAVEAALGVGVKDDDAGAPHDAKLEQRRKRYREKSVEDEANDESKPKRNVPSHSDQLAARRQKDRQRYASMSAEQRQIYNAKRREQYHRQSENSRQRRRERERSRYHALQQEAAKDRNARRAKLERERYQRLAPEELEAKNRKRRERAALARLKKSQERNDGSVSGNDASAPTPDAKKEEVVDHQEEVAATKVDVEAEAAAAAAAEENANTISV